MSRLNPVKVLERIRHYKSEVKKTISDGSEFKSLHGEIIDFFKALSIKKKDYKDFIQYPQTTKLWFETNNDRSKNSRDDFLQGITELLNNLESKYKMRVDLQ